MAYKGYYNTSGAADPTAYYALQHVRNEERMDARRKARRLVIAIRSLAAANGFILTKRIELKDKSNGYVFK